jgi:hypothetical protein
VIKQEKGYVDNSLKKENPNYYLFLLFNRTGEKCRTGSAWKLGGRSWR